MASIRDILRSRVVLAPPGAEAEDGRVLQLFNNRTQLKRAYAQAQDEIHLLRDRLKLQEGTTARVREQLEALQARLAVPVSGLQALVHYQLRGLWELARTRVADLVTELAAQREIHERRVHAAGQNRKAFEVLQRLQQALAAAERSSADVRVKLAAVQQELAANEAWWKYLRRRTLRRRQQVLQAENLAAEADVAAARQALEEQEQKKGIEYPGLSLEARRAINRVAIAYAALVATRLAPGGLIEPAMEAMQGSEPAGRTPGGPGFLALMERIGAAQEIVRACGGAAAQVKQLAAQLQPVARYSRELDTVPTADSLDAVLLLAAEGSGRVGGRNVLRDNLWDLDSLLL